MDNKETPKKLVFTSGRKALLLESLVLMLFGLMWANKSNEITVLLSMLVVTKLVVAISPLMDKYE